MKCPRCRKELKRQIINTGQNWTDGKEIIVIAYSCHCGYRKGTFK